MEGEKKRKFQPHSSSLLVEDYQKANLSQFASPHFPEIKSSSFRSSANFLKRQGDLGTESLITPIFNDLTTFSFFSSSLLPETASPLFLASPVSVEVQKDPKSSGFFASLASDVTQKIQTEQKRKSEKEIDLMWFLQRKLKFERENKLKCELALQATDLKDHIRVSLETSLRDHIAVIDYLEEDYKKRNDKNKELEKERKVHGL